MATNEADRSPACERIAEPNLPHGGKRILQLVRGLYVLRERRDWGEAAPRADERRERQEREFQPVRGF